MTLTVDEIRLLLKALLVSKFNLGDAQILLPLAVKMEQSLPKEEKKEENGKKEDKIITSK